MAAACPFHVLLPDVDMLLEPAHDLAQNYRATLDLLAAGNIRAENVIIHRTGLHPSLVGARKQLA